jgi:hypothetical protein
VRVSNQIFLSTPDGFDKGFIVKIRFTMQYNLNMIVMYIIDKLIAFPISSSRETKESR